MSTASKKALHKPPQFFRSTLARGIQSNGAESPVSRIGGMYGAGMIQGFSVITRGEALGHDLWVDSYFLQQVADFINASEAGVKSRFTHPGLSSDGLGKFLGRTKDAAVDGDVVRGDQHIAASAHKTPDGNLAEYIMDRATEDPASFGASIVFSRDFEAEAAFIEEAGGKIVYDDYGYPEIEGFVSPDPDNENNYPHSRLAELHAVDTVDDPAANPGGLFQRGQEVAVEAEALLAFSLGLSDEEPHTTSFGVDARRVQLFVDSFLHRHGLTVVASTNGGPTMAEDQEKTPDAPATETKPADSPSQPQTESKPTDASAAASGLASAPQPTTDGKRFLSAFGAQGGVWFAEGKTYAEARDLFTASLQAECEKLGKQVADLKKQLTAARGEAEPVPFNAEPTAEQMAAAATQSLAGAPGLATFAAGLRVAPVGK